MDKHTFGDTPAAVRLKEILEEKYDSSLRRYVSKRMVKFREILSEVEKIKSRSHQKYLVDLLMKDFRKKTQENNWPEEVGTFFLNVINSDYKEFVNED